MPASALIVANVDARGIFDGTTVGPQIASLADRLVPLGDDAGFRAKRDVDRVVAAAYALTGADVVAVVSGRFDEAKIAAVTKAKSGAPITKTMYSGRATYAVGPSVYTVLSARTLVAGTPLLLSGGLALAAFSACYVVVAAAANVPAARRLVQALGRLRRAP